MANNKFSILIPMYNSNGAGKADGILKLSLFFFVSLFAFSVGTYVGKRVSDNDRRRMAYDSEYDELRKVASAEADEVTSVISQDEVAELSEEFVKSATKKEKTIAAEAPAKDESEPMDTDGFTRVSRTKDEKPATIMAAEKIAATELPETKAPSKAAPTKTNNIVDKAAERVADNQAPLETPAEVRTLASVLPKIPSNTIGRYTVQIASYATEAEAKKHATHLKEQGYSAFYRSAKVNQQTWFRVSVGLFDSQKTANNFRREIMKQANIKSAIIQKIIQ